jgi:hypothetical protein
MTDIEQPPPQAERFGAATAGARTSMPSIEDLLTTKPARRGGQASRRILAVAGVVVLIGAGYALGRVTAPAGGPKLSHLAVTANAMPAGSRLTAGNLKLVTVRPGAQVPAGALTPAQARGLIGQVTQGPIPAGTFVASMLFGPEGAVPNGGQALVGLDLKPGQMPSGGLTTGQQVDVIEMPIGGNGQPLSPRPLVTTSIWYVRGPARSGDVSASVVVPAFMASHLAMYASHNEVALVATNRHKASPSPSTSSSHSAPSPGAKNRHGKRSH